MAVVFVTCKDKKEAEKISKDIVLRKLAACVNIIDRVESVFKWNGKLEKTRESLMIVKTTVLNLSKMQKRIKELHSYTCPEVIAMQISRSNKNYLNWVRRSCT